MTESLNENQETKFKTRSGPDETHALGLSIRDGFFAHIFATLTGGVFLTGFALALGANAFQIGILAAIPFLANIFQFAGSFLVRHAGSRKTILLRAIIAGRGLWILTALLPFAAGKLSPAQLILLCFTLIAISHVSGSVGAVSWLSWMADLVPDHQRGRFFGRRNMINGIAGVTVTILAGQYIDRLGNNMWGFQTLFLIAVVSGAISFVYLRRIPESLPGLRDQSWPFLRSIFSPIRTPNFRQFLLFAMIWGFGVNLAAPFFVVYLLEQLHLSYTQVAVFISLTSLLELLGMRFWGPISDKIGNRPVMLICAAVTAFLPLGWLFTASKPFSIYVLLPLLHITGGFFWAGMNLTSANILFRLAPRDKNTIYFATYASINGVFAAAAALGGGVLAKTYANGTLDLIVTQLIGLKIIFLISGLLRLLAMPLLRRVSEPAGVPFIQAVQVLRSIRSINTTLGFHPLLHYFLPTGQKLKK